MRLSNKKAFTIVEAVIAIILMAIIIVSFFTVFMSAFNYLRRVMELRAATLILQERISIVRNLSFPEVQALGGNFTSSWMSSLNNATGTIQQSSYDGLAHIRKVTLNLDWTAFDGASAHRTIVTLITDHGIDKR